jgi:hypothetical protein
VLDRLASSHGMIFPARRLSNNGAQGLARSTQA